MNFCASIPNQILKKDNISMSVSRQIATICMSLCIKISFCYLKAMCFFGELLSYYYMNYYVLVHFGVSSVVKNTTMWKKVFYSPRNYADNLKLCFEQLVVICIICEPKNIALDISCIHLNIYLPIASATILYLLK